MAVHDPSEGVLCQSWIAGMKHPTSNYWLCWSLILHSTCPEEVLEKVNSFFIILKYRCGFISRSRYFNCKSCVIYSTHCCTHIFRTAPKILQTQNIKLCTSCPVAWYTLASGEGSKDDNTMLANSSNLMYYWPKWIYKIKVKLFILINSLPTVLWGWCYLAPNSLLLEKHDYTLRAYSSHLCSIYGSQKNNKGSPMTR